MTLPDCLILTGPTASGKSALALALAGSLGGTIINADAMQCYRDLRILTARPTEAEERAVPHALYGTRDATDPGSAAAWRADALEAVGASVSAGRLPILCGGTGLYLAALVDGLADIPTPSEAARTEARGMLERDGSARLHAWLAARDPDTASSLRPTDGQRLARAAEVLLDTGSGLAAWRAAPRQDRAPFRFSTIRLDPGREALAAAIAGRFDAMIAAGAIGEARALHARGLPDTLPLMRAHGVRELGLYLAGQIDLDAARARTLAATLAYTRRQRTWARHHSLSPPARSFVIEPDTPPRAQQTQSIHWVRETFLKSEG